MSEHPTWPGGDVIQAQSVEWWLDSIALLINAGYIRLPSKVIRALRAWASDRTTPYGEVIAIPLSGREFRQIQRARKAASHDTP
jgi:hypothetical protein